MMVENNHKNDDNNIGNDNGNDDDDDSVMSSTNDSSSSSTIIVRRRPNHPYPQDHDSKNHNQNSDKNGSSSSISRNSANSSSNNNNNNHKKWIFTVTVITVKWIIGIIWLIIILSYHPSFLDGGDSSEEEQVKFALYSQAVSSSLSPSSTILMMTTTTSEGKEEAMHRDNYQHSLNNDQVQLLELSSQPQLSDPWQLSSSSSSSLSRKKRRKWRPVPKIYNCTATYPTRSEMVEWEQEYSVSPLSSSSSLLSSISLDSKSTTRQSSSIPSSSTITEVETRPCALLFFGLAKAFRHMVLPSIRRHILDVQEQEQSTTGSSSSSSSKTSKLKCDIFAHTYNITQLSNNTRNGEGGQRIDPTQLYELTSHVMIESVDEYESQHNMTHLLQEKFRVHHKHGWSTISYPNMLKQWHSIEQVWNLMEDYSQRHNVTYDRIGFFRSDVYYVTPINMFATNVTISNTMNGTRSNDHDHDKNAESSSQPSTTTTTTTETSTSITDAPLTAVIPSFGKMGNDRMFYGTYDNAYVWSHIRFPSVDCYTPEVPTQGLHSEHFMERLILPNIPHWTERSDICFLRVRGIGEIQDQDCRLNYDGPTDWKRETKKINKKMRQQRSQEQL